MLGAYAVTIPLLSCGVSWHPTQVLTFKYFSIKGINLASLAYQLYRIQRGDATGRFLRQVLGAPQGASLLEVRRQRFSTSSNQSVCQVCSSTLPPWEASLVCPRGQACCDAACPPALQLLLPGAPLSLDMLEGRCAPACEDNTMGLLLYRLLFVNAVVINALDVLVAAVRTLFKWPGQHDAAMVSRPPLPSDCGKQRRVLVLRQWPHRLWCRR